MEFRNHLFHRREVVVLFLDMDESLRKTDIDLRSNITSPSLNGENDLKQQQRRPPYTRYDVMREAVASFVFQKMKTTPNPAQLFFALYGVREDGTIEEWLPVVPSSSGNVEAVLRQRADACWSDIQRSPQEIGNGSCSTSGCGEQSNSATQSGGAPSKGFPFGEISHQLQRILDNFARKLKTSKAKGSSPHAAPYLVVHGIVLLSRSTTPPISGNATESTSYLAKVLNNGTAAYGDCWLDVVCLSPLRQPATALRTVQQRADINNSSVPRRGSDPVNDIKAAASAEEVVCCSCTILDPVSFTGISHRGLAVGATLTKLMCLHEHGVESYLQRPLFQISLPTRRHRSRSSASPTESQDRHQPPSVASPSAPNQSPVAAAAPVGTSHPHTSTAGQQHSPHSVRGAKEGERHQLPPPANATLKASPPSSTPALARTSREGVASASATLTYAVDTGDVTPPGAGEAGRRHTVSYHAAPTQLRPPPSVQQVAHQRPTPLYLRGAAAPIASTSPPHAKSSGTFSPPGASDSLSPPSKCGPDLRSISPVIAPQSTQARFTAGSRSRLPPSASAPAPLSTNTGSTLDNHRVARMTSSTARDGLEGGSFVSRNEAMLRPMRSASSPQGGAAVGIRPSVEDNSLDGSSTANVSVLKFEDSLNRSSHTPRDNIYSRTQ